MESCFLSLITYSCEALDYDRKQLQKFIKLNVCWTNVYRNVFRMQLWESVKELEFFCGRLDFTHIYSLKKLMFLHKLLRQNNICLSVCFSVFKRSTEFLSLCRNFDLVINQCSVSKLQKVDAINIVLFLYFLFSFFSFYTCFYVLYTVIMANKLYYKVDQHTRRVISSL